MREPPGGHNYGRKRVNGKWQSLDKWSRKKGAGFLAEGGWHETRLSATPTGPRGLSDGAETIRACFAQYDLSDLCESLRPGRTSDERKASRTILALGVAQLHGVVQTKEIAAVFGCNRRTVERLRAEGARLIVALRKDGERTLNIASDQQIAADAERLLTGILPEIADICTRLRDRFPTSSEVQGAVDEFLRRASEKDS